MTPYVTDSMAVYAITGLRHVSKSDWYPGSPDRFTLSVIYKNQTITVQYKSREERDETFQCICNAVKERV